MTKKSKREIELEQQNGELMQDLKRVRADFENYRKRVDAEKFMAQSTGRVSAIIELLPIIDNIERAISHVPENLKQDNWVIGILALNKNIEKMLDGLKIKRIDAKVGALFNPEFHEAVQFDDADGESEIVAEELRVGYLLNDEVLRPSMVKVTKK